MEEMRASWREGSGRKPGGKEIESLWGKEDV